MSRLSLLLLASVFFLDRVIGLWHAYNNQRGVNKDCASNVTGAVPQTADGSHVFAVSIYKPFVLSNEEVKRYKLWPGLMSVFDQQNGESMVGFREAMEVIWKNQHPEDCSTAKFMIAEGWAQGFGSEVHVIGLGLALAVQMGRVYVLDPRGPPKTNERDNGWQTQNKFCARQKRKTLECYFEPWTHCPIDVIMGSKTVEDLKSDREKTYFSDTQINQRFEKEDFSPISNERVILLENRGDVPYFVPRVFDKLLDCSPMHGGLHKYWWRTVSAAYLLRPNRETIALIHKYRKSSESLKDFDESKERCISIYVRRGDKHVEMKMVEDEIYFQTAKKMWDGDMVRGPDSPEAQINPGQGDGGQFGGGKVTKVGEQAVITLKPKGVGSSSGGRYGEQIGDRDKSLRTIFIGSEDPNTIEFAKIWGKKNGWRILYTDLFDRRQVSAAYNHSVQADEKKTHTDRHHELEYFSMLLNLDFHLRCEAFVCTILSNFCRVIDELRASVGGKANRHFADLSETCDEPPCIDEKFHISW